MRQDDLNPTKSVSGDIPGRALNPVSPTNACEQEFIAGSPRDQPKRAELNYFKGFDASQSILTSRAQSTKRNVILKVSSRPNNLAFSE